MKEYNGLICHYLLWRICSFLWVLNNMLLIWHQYLIACKTLEKFILFICICTQLQLWYLKSISIKLSIYKVDIVDIHDIVSILSFICSQLKLSIFHFDIAYVHNVSKYFWKLYNAYLKFCRYWRSHIYHFTIVKYMYHHLDVLLIAFVLTWYWYRRDVILIYKLRYLEQAIDGTI